jgi:methionyl-tRNA synthetase
MYKRLYLTTPIYYASDAPHLGHAYTTVVADALARHHRLRGRDVRLLTGTDDHGQKIAAAAARRGVAPKSYADEVSEAYQACWRALGISHDGFIRTTDADHEAAVRELWGRLVAGGWIELRPYAGWYCVGCEQFYLEKDLVWQRTGWYCPVHKRATERVEEDNYFFRLGAWREPLLALYARVLGQSGRPWIEPAERMNEVAAAVQGGLADLSVSRTNTAWGVPVPGDPAHVVYVWLDALVNYYSATRRGAFAGFWGDDVEIVHLMGKEITRFHGVYWPAILQAAGLRVPSKIVAHGWWTVNGEKMSKTRGNVVDPLVLAADVGADAFRYFILREVPLGQDGDFSHARLIQRYNAELANDLGNLVNRTLGMARKYLPSGEVRPPADVPPEQGHSPAASDPELVISVNQSQVRLARKMERFELSEALGAAWEIVRVANHYIERAAPWRLDAARREAVLWDALETCRVLGHCLSPFMPERAAALLRQIGRPEAPYAAAFGDRQAPFAPEEAAPLFPRIDEARKAALLAKWLGA